MMNGYGGWGMGAWLLISVITLVVLAVIVVGVVALSRRSNATARGGTGSRRFRCCAAHPRRAVRPRRDR